MLSLTGAQAPTDRLHVRSLGGDDTVDASGLGADALRLTVEAGAGADTVRGSRGPDLAFLGADDDRFEWAPGDGSDV